MKKTNKDLKWHVIFEGSGSITGNSWIEEVAYLGNEQWLLRIYDDPLWSFAPEEPIFPEEKTSDELVIFVTSIDAASNKDALVKPRQKSLYDVAISSGAIQCIELLKKSTSNRAGDSLLLWLGPPLDDCQKDLFNKYQGAKKDGEPHHDGDWETFEEREIAAKLFEHDNEAPSAFDELLTKLFGSPIRITDYFFSMGVNRGLWVATINISRSNVLREKGSSVTWPPPKDINNAVAGALSHMLKRKWVDIFA